MMLVCTQYFCFCALFVAEDCICLRIVWSYFN